ncbi:MAG: hypothetical protein GF400_08050 [Candidatus Eisenbacteria bacterium]|nr:hypothetical protein [Candidatus Eisenbacteria bacterium]
MPSRFEEADLAALARVGIEERGGLVNVEDFVDPFDPGEDMDRLLGVVPRLYSGADFAAAVSSVVGAAREKSPVIAMVGAHFIKCGLSRLLIDLMQREVVTAVALNGAGAIHDFEIAMWGRTSEDVARRLPDGSFGMCSDTADAMNEATSAGAGEEEGLGESLGRALVESEAPHLASSILGSGRLLDIPVTVHVALGTDIVHQHASADGAAIGATSLRDFRILASVVSELAGGVVLNIGSAVVLPEVFLKALSIARNLGGARGPLTAVSMDMNEPYRAMTNVVRRPTAQEGRGIALRGRHELLFPLFWVAVRRSMAG